MHNKKKESRCVSLKVVYGRLCNASRSHGRELRRKIEALKMRQCKEIERISWTQKITNEKMLLHMGYRGYCCWELRISENEIRRGWNLQDISAERNNSEGTKGAKENYVFQTTY